ncbi:MAG: hypothetical protein CO167_12480 [Candidatus Marinimicrobia bacterium CG_4_9_14_3_um_filter_48_9]|nr:MAG: hypothetical protein CO167_12480 [Candidatus Marinimicrobia bacterium CG_4_9_14_3_um_filter_48_9]
MHTKIQKWGNSQGLRIAKHLLQEAQIELGDEVEIAVQDGKLVISPLKNVRNRYKLADQAKEILTGSESFFSEWKDFTTILRFLQYRILSAHPEIHNALVTYYNNPLNK